MKGTALLYQPGSLVPEVTELEASPVLIFLQTCIKGYLESVPSFDSIEYGDKIRRCAVFCNEEGKLEGLPLNKQATILWDRALRRALDGDGSRPYPNGLFGQDGNFVDVLVGPIMVLIGDEEFLDSL